jgi:hypothetical protein
VDVPPDAAEPDAAEPDDAGFDELLYDAVLAVPDDYGEPGEDPDEPFPPSEEEEASTALPSKVESWRRRSATGAILTGFALGLQQVFEPKRDEPSITVQTSGDPPRDLPVDADFEYQRPRQSVVSIRPWLLDEQTAESGRDADSPGNEPPAPGSDPGAGPGDSASTP